MSAVPLEPILSADSFAAWSAIRDQLTALWAAPYLSPQPLAEVKRREAATGLLDLLLSHSAWDLWGDFAKCVPQAADEAAEFWSTHSQGKAVLILDCLSLRELPILLAEAESHGFGTPLWSLTGAPLPPDTNTFARALGFVSRGALDNNGAASPRFPGAHTLSHKLPWLDAAHLVPPEPALIVWHHWPDDLIHQRDGADGGLDRAFPEIAQQLRSDEFWMFARKLATGRHLVLTSDHGYANSGGFHNVEPDQKDDLKGHFSAQRFRAGRIGEKEWLPPLAQTLTGPQGEFTAVLGRRKWQVPGGFPTLSHGGLTLLETFVPWLVLNPQ